MYLSIYIVSIYIYNIIYFIDFYVIFNEKSKKMKKMRVCVRECGGAPPVFVDDLFCKLLYTAAQLHSFIVTSTLFTIHTNLQPQIIYNTSYVPGNMINHQQCLLFLLLLTSYSNIKKF